MPSINEDIRDGLLAFLTDLVGVEGEAAAFALSVLEFLRHDVAELLVSRGDKLPRRSVEKLVREMDALIDAAFEKLDKGIAKRVVDVADVAQGKTYAILKDAIKVRLGKPVYTADDIRRIGSNLVVQGAPVREWWDAQRRSTRTRFAAAVRQGMAANEGVSQIVQRVLGAPTGRKLVVEVNGRKRVIAERAGGAIGLTRNHADALVRTAVLEVNNQVLMDIYEANASVVKGVQALTVLDFRTSPVCQPRGGWAWSLKDGKPIPSYNTAPIDFPGRPPWHQRCRSVLIPVLKSWEELGGVKIKEFDSGLRASMDGQVSNKITYDDWLRQRDKRHPGSIERVFGDGVKAKLFREGASTRDFVDALGNPKTVAQLKIDYGIE